METKSKINDAPNPFRIQSFRLNKRKDEIVLEMAQLEEVVKASKQVGLFGNLYAPGSLKTDIYIYARVQTVADTEAKIKV